MRGLAGSGRRNGREVHRRQRAPGLDRSPRTGAPHRRPNRTWVIGEVPDQTSLDLADDGWYSPSRAVRCVAHGVSRAAPGEPSSTARRGARADYWNGLENRPFDLTAPPSRSGPLGWDRSWDHRPHGRPHDGGLSLLALRGRRRSGALQKRVLWGDSPHTDPRLTQRSPTGGAVVAEGRPVRNLHRANGWSPRKWRRLARQSARPWNETSDPIAVGPPYQINVLSRGVSCMP